MSEFYFSIPTINLINILAIIVSLVLIGVVLWLSSEGKEKIIAIIFTGSIVILITYLSLISPLQAKVVLDDTLEVSIPPYAHEIIQKDEILRAYVVDLEKNESLRPKYKKIGGGMGNSKMGKYKLTNGKDAIVMTTGTKVVCLELEEKYILLSPNRFDDFVDELNEKFIPIE